MNLNKEAPIDQEWISVENYEFKILVMIACLAQEKLAFRGKLKDMCEFLGIKENSCNRAKIKEIIHKLERQGDIKAIQEKQFWVLYLTSQAERKPKIVKIKNEYIKAIQEYKAENPNDRIGWENILKVLVYLWDKNGLEYTQKEIARITNTSEAIVGKAIKALTKINFSDLSFEKKKIWFKSLEGKWLTSGSKYTLGYNWNKK